MISEDTWIYSTDMYIDTVAEDNGITYNEAFSLNIKAATEFNERKLNSIVTLRKDVIWDQTNLGVGKRRKIINRMRNAGYRVECECILLPAGDSQWEDWQHRMASRPGKTIPDHVIESMMDSFVRPTVDEGFDAVRCYDMYGNRISD
jgi:predicted ABC-type ATPase